MRINPSCMKRRNTDQMSRRSNLRRREPENSEFVSVLNSLYEEKICNQKMEPPHIGEGTPWDYIGIAFKVILRSIILIDPAVEPPASPITKWKKVIISSSVT